MSIETKDTQKDEGWEDINIKVSIYSKIVDLEMHIVYAIHIEGKLLWGPDRVLLCAVRFLVVRVAYVEIVMQWEVTTWGIVKCFSLLHWEVVTSSSCKK